MFIAMKAKNLSLLLMGILMIGSCQKEESVLLPADNLSETTAANELKCGQVTQPVTINFLGVEYTTEDNSVFHYEVISGTKPALSHWNIHLVPDLSGSGVSDVVLLSSSDPTASFGPDGSLKKMAGNYYSLSWLKFDQSYNDGEQRLVTFTLQGHWYVGDVLVLSKSGKYFTTNTLQGPISVLPAVIPTIKITEIDNISNNAADVHTSLSGGIAANMTERGVCWSTNNNPIISGDHVISGTGDGDFTNTLDGLSRNTLYYVRSYVIYNNEVIYSDETSFSTTNTR